MITVQARAALSAVGKLRSAQAKRIEDSLTQCANIVLRESQRLVPKDTRKLEESARVVTTGKGFRAKSSVEYNTHYAWPVHEDPDATHAPPTTYKFLTKAVAKTRGTCTALLKRQMNAKIEGV